MTEPAPAEPTESEESAAVQESRVIASRREKAERMKAGGANLYVQR